MAEALIYELHGRLLRLLADSSRVHVANKPCRIDDAFAVCSHSATASGDCLVGQVGEALAQHRSEQKEPAMLAAPAPRQALPVAEGSAHDADLALLEIAPQAPTIAALDHEFALP